MARISYTISLDGDSSGAKRALDEVAASMGRLNESTRNMPSFMGGAGGSRGLPPLTGQYNTSGLLLDSRGMPIMPNQFFNQGRLVPPLTSSSPYGTNSFYGGMSPGGILPDGRRMPNTDQKIEQLTEQLERLGETIKGVNEDLTTAREKGDLKTEGQLSGTLNNLKAAEVQTENQLKSLERERDRKDSPDKNMGNAIAGYFANQILHGLIGAGQTIV